MADWGKTRTSEKGLSSLSASIREGSRFLLPAVSRWNHTTRYWMLDAGYENTIVVRFVLTNARNLAEVVLPPLELPSTHPSLQVYDTIQCTPTIAQKGSAFKTVR